VCGGGGEIFCTRLKKYIKLRMVKNRLLNEINLSINIKKGHNIASCFVCVGGGGEIFCSRLKKYIKLRMVKNRLLNEILGH